MTLQPLTPADHAAAAAIFNHWIVNSTAVFHLEPLSVAEFVAEVTYADPRHAAFAVRAAPGGPLAGFVTVAPHSNRAAYAATASVSIYLHPEHVGQGLGRQALAEVDAHAERHGLRVLLAGVCEENEPSLRLFARAGYVEVGRLRQVGEKFGRRLDVAYLEKLLG